jgi:hypothetical protein
MVLTDIIKLEPVVSLVIILALLGASIVASLVADRREGPRPADTGDAPGQVPG